jgi:AraC-like DNA-binding protein
MSPTDQFMMDIDLLREGVFGGRLPSPARLQALTGAAERIVAVQGELPAAPPQTHWLRIHPGIGYLLWRGPSPLARLDFAPGTLIGESQSLAQGLVHGIQQALVALRRRELAPVARRQTRPPTFAHECEARSLLVALLQASQDWRESWAWWSQVVLLRHQYQINAVRRKLVEVMALATRDVDVDTALSWPVRAYLDLVLETYALTPLISGAATRLADIAPLLSGHRPDRLPSSLHLALTWSEAHLNQPLSLRHAAHAAGISSEHLARLARRHLGQPLLVYLTHRRLAEAKRRLVETDDTLAEVATQCGFGSSEHFQRTFRRLVGDSPGRWRRTLNDHKSQR